MNWRAPWRRLTSWIRGRGLSREASRQRDAGPAPSIPEPVLSGFPPREIVPPPDAPAGITHADGLYPAASQEADREEHRRPAMPPIHRHEALDLIIGLDFGTAATKVVVRSPFYAGGRAVAVSFGDLGHRTSPYLLPTRVWAQSDGGFSLAPRGEGAWSTGLKLSLMDLGSAPREAGHLDEEADRLAPVVGYLALVIAEAQARVLATERDTYGHFDIRRWTVNLGIPSAGYDDTRTRAVFQRAAWAAWDLAKAGGAVSRDRVAAMLQRNGEAAPDPEVEVVPEVAAQAVGYARSTLRDPGLHLLVDVGATTLDICGFVLHQAEGRDRYELLTTTVERLGVLELHRNRLDALSCRNVVSKLDDFLAPVPETMAEYHPGCSCSCRDVDNEFMDGARRLMMRDLLLLKGRRDPNSRRWASGLPAFLCGGGSGMWPYSKVMRDAKEEFCRWTTAVGLHLRTLPKPAQLANEDLDETMFHRLSVAYGLSFDALDIGEIAPPNTISNIPSPGQRIMTDRFVSKDMV
jgi:hypothetical protein